MEVDFDKEIDALMRSNGGGRTITISEFAAPHIDADTLNAFAENALPDAARKGYMTHLADCDGCRKTLSSLISMNAEAEPVSAVSAIPAVIAETSVPWYKSLFAVQNLAYGMGALVIAFSGFIGYTVLQNTGMGDSAATVSQVSDQRPASGPMVSDSDTFAANTTSNAASSAAANTNTALSANRQPAQLAKGAAANSIVGEDLAIATERPAISADGVDVMTAPPPPPPAAAAPITKPKESRPEDDAALRDRTDKSNELKVLSQQEEQMPSAGNMPNTQAGPSRNIQRDNRASGEREMAKKRAVTSPALGRIASPSKTVGGKNFSIRDNVWYDSSYSGQGTTNVRRGTDDYRKLDNGLRSIAESLEGVVVVVWKSKAYRIQ
jgi:hypothetical protein